MRLAIASTVAWAAVACGGATALSTPNDAGQSPTPDASGEAAAKDAGTGATNVDGSAPGCVLVDTSYDQACKVDSDCVEVSAGNYCTGPRCMCGGSAISASALARFQADVARVYDGGGSIACPCAANFGPCCRAGACTLQCWSSADTLPACAAAGGSCAPPNAGCGSAGGAPRVLDGGCAFPDEMCCL